MSRSAETLVDTLSYFFLLPNYCFMHFPVVDYRTMQRGYFADDVHAIQRRGLQMMFRGTVHLLALSPGLPRDVDSRRRGCTTWPVSLATWSATTCLYLQVSGQFHIACGMLHLFGFQLPETHHNYLLATGFTDYWRRINIYWKDFMVRLFFNPVVFRLKRWPQPAALAAGTIGGLPGHLALARLPVVLAARELGFLGSGRPFLGHPGRAGAGERPARRPPQPNGAARRGRLPRAGPRFASFGCAFREGRRHIHHDRRALVAVVEPEPVGLARNGQPWVSWIMRNDEPADDRHTL